MTTLLVGFGQRVKKGLDIGLIDHLPFLCEGAQILCQFVSIKGRCENEMSI